MRRHLTPLLLSLLFVPVGLHAEIMDSSTGGFASRNVAAIAASPSEVYAALVQNVSAWWSSDHTYSGDAANLSLEARQGGCFCESLPGGGSVRHLGVVYADPGKVLRLIGGLGPLQATAVTGAMTWTLSEIEGGTQVTLDYTVGGYVPQGLDSWAEAVDGVVGEQLERLARFVETGDPDAATTATEPAEGGPR